VRDHLINRLLERVQHSLIALGFDDLRLIECCGCEHVGDVCVGVRGLHAHEAHHCEAEGVGDARCGGEHRGRVGHGRARDHALHIELGGVRGRELTREQRRLAPL
jgi:hypothetical protein